MFLTRSLISRLIYLLIRWCIHTCRLPLGILSVFIRYPSAVDLLNQPSNTEEILSCSRCFLRFIIEIPIELSATLWCYWAICSFTLVRIDSLDFACYFSVVPLLTFHPVLSFSLSLSPSLCFSVYYIWFFNNKKIFHANFMREIFKIKSYLKDRRQKFFKTKINTTTKFLQKFGKKAHSRIVSQTNLEDAKSLHLHTCRCSCTLSLARSKASGFDKFEVIEHIRRVTVFKQCKK